MADVDSPPQFLRASELAKRLDCGKSTIYALARTRQIPSVLIGRTGRRFEWRAVMEALQK